jgi:hypothetical protein
MTTLHQAIEKALQGLLIPPLRDLVIEYIGTIRVKIRADHWEYLLKEGERSLESIEWQCFGGGDDQVVAINSCYLIAIHGHPSNSPFKCRLTIDKQYQPHEWVFIDPDANAIIGFE